MEQIFYYLALMGIGQIMRYYSAEKVEYANFLNAEEERYLLKLRGVLAEILTELEKKKSINALMDFSELLVTEVRNISYARIASELFLLSKTRYEQYFKYERRSASWKFDSHPKSWIYNFAPVGRFENSTGKTVGKLKKLLFDPELAEHFADSPKPADCLHKFKTDIKKALRPDRYQSSWFFLEKFFSSIAMRRDHMKAKVEYYGVKETVKSIKQIGLNASVEDVASDIFSNIDFPDVNVIALRKKIDMMFTYHIAFPWFSPFWSWSTQICNSPFDKQDWRDKARFEEFFNHPPTLSDFERVNTQDRDPNFAPKKSAHLVDKMAYFDVICWTGKFADLATKNEVVKLPPSIATHEQENKIKFSLLSIYTLMYKRWRKIDRLADSGCNLMFSDNPTVYDSLNIYELGDDSETKAIKKLARANWINFGYNTPKKLLEEAVSDLVNQLIKEKVSEAVMHLTEHLTTLPQTIIDVATNVEELKKTNINVEELKKTVNMIIDGNSPPNLVVQQLTRVLHSVGTQVEDLQKQKQGIVLGLNRFLKKIEDDDSAATVNELVCLIRDIRNELTAPPHTL